MRVLYLLAVYLAAPIVSLLLLWRGLWDRSYWRNFSERFGFGPVSPPHGVWLHAVSVGEVQACAPLVSALHRRHPQLPLTVTTFTPTGASRARALFGNVAQVRYLPFDLPGAVRRFLARVQPQLAVIFETELWPNLYRECARRRVPLVIASARLSQRSVRRALASTSGTRRRPHSRYRFGHSSVSKTTASRGCTRAKKRRTAPGRS